MAIPQPYRREIEDALLPMGISFESVLCKIEQAKQQYIRDMEKWSAARYQDGEIIGRKLIWRTNTRGLEVSARTKRLASPGKLPKDAVRAYTRRLLVIYHDATGSWTVRKRVPVLMPLPIGRHYKETPDPFLLACYRYAGIRPKQYPFGIVTQLLRDLNPHGSVGRPRRQG